MPLCLIRSIKYIKYTKRHAYTQKFESTKAEDILYNEVSEYLRRETLRALPNSQRKLMTMILRKLLASSSYAIAGTLESLIVRLEAMLETDSKLYGEIDINNYSDLELINNSDIITNEVNMAANIPSNFDYESGDVFSDSNNIIKTHDTWNRVEWFKFNHCLIGKSNRIIIYRINKCYVPRNRSTRRRYINNSL